MKKFLGIFTAVVMSVAMTVTAFAAPSVTVTGTVTEVSAATDANGNAVTVTIADVPAALQAAVAEVRTTATLQTVLGSDFTADMAVVDVKEITVPEGTTFPATLTFNVPGVTANSKGSLLHYNTTTNAWEKIATTFGNGTMTGTFNSLSPVAFVVDKTTASTTAAGTTSTTSPKTGEMNVMMMAGAVALLAVAGMAVTYKKRKEA